MSALAPFRIRSFCFQWPADLVTSWAVEMESLILGWYLLVETGSLLVLTIFGSLQFMGTLVAPLFGVAGDRIGHRNLLCAMRATYATLAASLMTLAFLGALSPLQVLVVAGVMGLVRPSDLVMRNALVGATMPAVYLMGAVSISRMTMDSARIAGALAGAGLLAALGMGRAYLVIASLYCLSFALTLGVAGATPPAAGAAPSPHASPWRNLGDAVANVWTTPPVLAAMALAFLVNLTAFPLLGGLMPYVAKEVLGTDQTGLGYLVASVAFGALAGSLALSLNASALRPARMMIVFSIVWYLLILVFAHRQTMLGAALVLMLAGFAQSLSLIPMSVMLLRSSDPRVRGGIMGIRMLAVYGMPLGLMAAGPLIDRFGYPATATLYCVSGVVLTLIIAARWRAHLWPLEAPANAR